MIWGQAALPDGLRSRLPSVENAWAGFTRARRSWERVGRRAGPIEPVDRVSDLEQFVADIEEADEPTLHFAHIELPHAPWMRRPERRVVRAARPAGLHRPANEPIRWFDDPVSPSPGFNGPCTSTATPTPCSARSSTSSTARV